MIKVNSPRRHNNAVSVTNKIPSKYMRQKLTELKRERDKSIITAGVFYTLLSLNNRSSAQQMSKDIK